MRYCALDSGATRAWYYRSSYQNTLVICQWQSPDSTSETTRRRKVSVCAPRIKGWILLTSLQPYFNFTNETLRLKVEVTCLWPQSHRFVGSQYGVLSIIPSWRGLRTAHSLAPRQTPKYDHFNFYTRQGKLNWYLSQRLHPSSLRVLLSAHASGGSSSPRPFTPPPSRLSPPLSRPDVCLVLPDVVVSPGDTWGTATSSQARAGNMAAAGVVSGKVGNGPGGTLQFFSG